MNARGMSGVRVLRGAEWAPGLVKALPWLVALILAVLLGRSVYSWWVSGGTPSAGSVAQSTARVASPGSAPPPGNVLSLRALAGMHLFGQATAKSTAAPINAPDSTLNLVLHGVFDLSTPSRAMAIIADGQGHQSFYRTGDTLPGQGVLYRVYADRVILRRAGHYETLRMPEAMGVTGSRPDTRYGQGRPYDPGLAGRRGTPAYTGEPPQAGDE